MNKTLTFLLLLLPLSLLAQVKPTNRVVYLWDITYSMHGGYFAEKNPTIKVPLAGKHVEIIRYDRRHDIYDKVLDALVEDIKKKNEHTEIVVIPFNDKVLDCWRELATDDGKAKLIKKIKEFDDISQTHTGISGALEYALNTIFDSDVPSILELLTDGKESVNKIKFYQILDNWCNYAEGKKVQGYYFMLSDEALNGDPDLLQRLEKHCFTVITQLDDVNFAITKSYITLNPTNTNLQVSEVSEKPFAVNVNFVQGVEEAKCKIRFVANENSYFSLDTVVTVNADTKNINLHLNNKKPLAEILEAMPTEQPTNLRILTNLAEDDENVQLQSEYIELNLINKKMKKITIYVKKQ